MSHRMSSCVHARMDESVAGNEMNWNERMDGWMDGWMAGWVGAWMDGWMDGRKECMTDQVNQR